MTDSAAGSATAGKLCYRPRMPAGLFGVVAGIASALSFGSADFSGGLAARRSGAMVVAAAVQVVGLVALLAGLAMFRPAVPEPAALWIAVAAGVAGGTGLAALYQGLAIGAMGLVAALSALGSVLIPAVVSGLTGTPLTPLQLAGVALAGSAAMAAGGASREGVSRAALGLAALAALAFGSWYVLLDLGAETGDPLWILVVSRGTSALLLGSIVAVRRSGTALRGGALLVVVAGLLDVGGNIAFVISSGAIPVGLAAALSGLYPLVTMTLARTLLGEALPRLGMVAVGMAIAAVALISLG